MTFSIVARDASGAIGSAVCSSSPAVAARCLHLADGIGGVNTQNVTDPRLGARILDLLRAGQSAPDALSTVVENSPDIDVRQILVIDDHGLVAVYSGPRALGVFGDAIGEGAAAGGNMLAAPGIPRAMIDAFEETVGELEWRLMAALRAAITLGGEAGPVHSAGLAVVRGLGWRVSDLRVDWSDADPVADLDVLLSRWMPQRDDYIMRAVRPAMAPAYGVPGDE